jgi:hypothetical protein
MMERHGVDSMPETAENVAIKVGIGRAAQDRMALASQAKALTARTCARAWCGWPPGRAVPSRGLPRHHGR